MYNEAGIQTNSEKQKTLYLIKQKKLILLNFNTYLYFFINFIYYT